jgi:hypothetical protein
MTATLNTKAHRRTDLDALGDARVRIQVTIYGTAQRTTVGGHTIGQLRSQHAVYHNRLQCLDAWLAWGG